MTLIQRHDGTVYDLLDYGIRTRDLIISSPTPQHNFGTVEGTHGVIDYGTTYGPRNITGYFRAISDSVEDFSFLRDKIFHLFRTEESFYLIEKRIRGKRWLVKVTNPYQIPQRGVYGNFDIQFVGIKGVSESVRTTKDIDEYGIEPHFEEWAFGMGIPLGEDLKYSHEGKVFRIFNAGNVPVHPFEQELIITIENVQGSDSFFELRNLTNNTRFRATEPVTDIQTIVIDGPLITSNGLAYTRKTTKDFIELSPGWNEFEIDGADSAKVSFDFRFYYL